MKIQLNTILFAKTLVRKDVASSAPTPASTATSTDGKTSPPKSTTPPPTVPSGDAKVSAPDSNTGAAASTGVGQGATSSTGTTAVTGSDDAAEFSSKAQIMTLMTTDVDRVAEFAWHCFSLFGKGVNGM